MMKLDVSDMPFANDTFHIILCIHVLQAVRDDRKALSELFRVLKPNGWAILQVPIDVNQPHTVDTALVVLQQENASQFSPARLYGQDYLELLQQAGFDVHIDDFVRRLPQNLITCYGLNPNEDIYICYKG
ncbi:MAG TPA: methyltransferase domain-containing protein [Ktedonosporobacter sp.]|jgi:ubiquinone/menaquinone biosynthesis C-methylase UbiE|nr:methyltransferase domain-containing protein [Ktedonosporobacter sp.]